MKDNKEFIKGIYDKYDEYLKDNNSETFKQVKNQKKSFINSNFAKVLSAAAVFAIVISGTFIANNLLNNNQGTLIGKTTTKDKISLKTVDNFENFYNIVKENSKDDYRSNILVDYDTEDFSISNAQSETSSSIFQGANFSNSGESTSLKSSESSTTNSSRTNEGDYSKTNIQVEGVDEADIVKTNGKYIFYVVSNKLLIVDIQNKEKINKVAEMDYSKEDFKPTEIYIKDSSLIVLGNSSSYSRGKTVKETSNSVYKRGVYKQRAVAIVYDISNVTIPKEERRVEIDGNYVSSRMIGNNIYFVSNKSIYSRNILDTEIKDLDEDLYKPSYVDTASTTTEKLIDFDRVYYFNDIETLNYLTLGGFSLDSKQEADVKTFLGAGEDVYCSTENMYIVKSKNVYDADTYKSFGEDTKILKFNLNSGKITFKAEADIEGGINNQFSMDESNGYFRIATTIGRTYNMDSSTSNTLYILDKDLKEVGRLDGIAKGEKIYSVRYVGNKAYVVTFKEIDPLFVIDLSDVRNPKVLGELKIPGYSTYLHPYDETHLIGFGYDTKTNAYGTGVQNDGLKMAMFDVSDLSNPKELFNVKIGQSGTSSPLTSNHKALLFSKEKNLIAFPVTSYENRKTEYKAQVYDIDLAKGFTLRGEIKHEKEQANSQKYYYSYGLSIDRIIYSDNIFYTLSKNMIKASDMDTVKELSVLDIQQ